MTEYLFAGWRLGHPPGAGADGLPLTVFRAKPPLTLFETIEQAGIDDAETFIIARGEAVFTILNVFPYTSGHVMVLPKRASPTIGDLNEAEFVELWAMVRTAAEAVKTAFSPDGLNIGVNEGMAGGGSQPDHLHVHIVPRWNADTNFISTTATARILPMTLADSWDRLRSAWASYR